MFEMAKPNKVKEWRCSILCDVALCALEGSFSHATWQDVEREVAANSG
jgi:hypothetical protein